jgi:hypothetical protein
MHDALCCHAKLLSLLALSPEVICTSSSCSISSLPLRKPVEGGVAAAVEEP